MQEAESQRETAGKFINFLVSEMRSGADRGTIAQKLTAMGVDPIEGRKLVDSAYDDIMNAARKERPTPASILRGAAGGVLAAAVGGLVWGFIVRFTDYEIGFMAWGLGLLAGAAVVIFSGGRKGAALQLLAVASGILGILIGKYYIFTHLMGKALMERYGAETAATVSLLSGYNVSFFLNHMREFLSPYDALWAILAIMTAWRMPKSLGIKVASNRVGPIG